MSTINYLTTLSTISYTAPGVRAAASTIHVVATSGALQYTSNISLTLLSGSTITASSIGIGTTNPGSYPLNVNGPLNCTGLNVNSAPYVGSQWTSSTLNGTVSSVYFMGNVGVNTGPITTYTLNVGGPLNCTGLNVNSAPYVGSQWTTSSSNIYYSGGNVGVGIATPQNTFHVYNNTASSSSPPDGGSTSGQIVLTNSKTGTTVYAMSIGMDQSYGIGYLNAAGNSAVQPICLNTRGGGIGIGNTNPGSYTLNVTGSIYASSDITAMSDQRFKTNIVPLNDSLSKLLQLQGVSYELKDDANKKSHLGFLAQEVEKTYPEVVHYDAQLDKYSMNYTGLIAPLIESIKELKQIIEKQERRIQELEKRSL
jgi:Chaperone of endosialidase